MILKNKNLNFAFTLTLLLFICIIVLSEMTFADTSRPPSTVKKTVPEESGKESVKIYKPVESVKKTEPQTREEFIEILPAITRKYQGATANMIDAIK